MENVLVLKDLLYGKDNAGGVTVVADLSDVDTLEDGAIGIFGARNGALLGAAADADYVDEKEFIMAWNVGGVIRRTKPIVRQGIKRLDIGDYVAPVFHTVQAGGVTAALKFGFADSDVGDVSIKVTDRTFSGMYATHINDASVYKKATMTIENTVDALVVKLNANTNLPVIATKITGGAGIFGITIQSQTRGQILSLMGDGLLEGMNRDVDGTNASVLPVVGAGVAVDVLQHEKDASMNWGNANYRELTEEFYSQANATVALATYKSLTFQEELPKPYLGETNVKPSFTIYLPEAAATLNTAVLAVLQRLIEGAYTTATAPEPGA